MNRTPKYSKLCVFDYLAYPNLWLYRAHKLDAKSAPHIFPGYLAMYEGYIYFKMVTSCTVISRDVSFVEENFSDNASLGDDGDGDRSTAYHAATTRTIATPKKVTNVDPN